MWQCRYLAPCLKRMPPALYQGVDLSETALAEAHEYLVELAGEVVLTHGDLLEAVESTALTWDVLFTGFAIHHLMPEQKARFFQAAGRCLSEKGWFIMVDVVREENQDRESYLEGYLRFMREKWTACRRINWRKLVHMCASTIIPNASPRCTKWRGRLD